MIALTSGLFRNVVRLISHKVRQCATRVALRTLLGRAMVPLFVVQDHPMLALLASFFRSCRRQERADARKNDEISLLLRLCPEAGGQNIIS